MVVSDITWENWGGSESEGRGTALYTPTNKSFAESLREPTSILAFDLGDCQGILAYRKVVWYFPQYGEELDRTSSLDICSL